MGIALPLGMSRCTEQPDHKAVPLKSIVGPSLSVVAAPQAGRWLKSVVFRPANAKPRRVSSASFVLKGSVPKANHFLHWASLATIVCALGLGGVHLKAQSIYGSVRGAVADPNGAAITGAKVSLTNEGTSETHATITNGAGQYIFSEVVPGTYSLTAESAGFKKFERKGVTIATQQEATADLKLEIGAVTESIQVTEAAPLVDTANASQGQVVTNQQVTDLPNMGRNPFLLSKLVNTVIPVGNPAYNRMEDQSGSSQISIAGGPVRGNNYLLDGIPITDADNRAIIIPSLEVVQEVNVQANTYDAEMARTGGGMFNTLMKSGANEYHGSAYGHLRRTGMDANSFFNNAAGVPISPEPNTTWGASFGGAVRIPKIYDGRNKTFFYLGEEHYDDTQSASQEFSLPTANERVGNFSGRCSTRRGTARYLQPERTTRERPSSAVPEQHHPGEPTESSRPGDSEFVSDAGLCPGLLWSLRSERLGHTALPC